MSHKAAIAAIVLAAATSPAAAQVTGGLGVEYSAPLEGGDFGGTTYYGAIEYAFNRNFSFGADLSGYRLDNINTDASSATLHGIYHFSDTLSLGAFYGIDRVNEVNSDLYGIEAGTEFMGGEVEGYLARLDGTTAEATLLGVDGLYSLSGGFALTGNLDMSVQDANDVRRVAIGGQYVIDGGPQFYAEIGNASVETGGVTADQNFIGIGARVAIGNQRGTTFNPRSLYEILPGF